ncbi:hypothetical protein DL768_006142 [Monosporascus sp. mg162]|nr:hypothetical protein DL768_006142 [Monosporascus sp. mg162]
MLLRYTPCRCGQIWDQRYPLHVSGRVLRDTIAGSRTLHAVGIAYGDLYIGNILVTLWGVEHLIQLNELLEPLPLRLKTRRRRVSCYYGPDGELLEKFRLVNESSGTSDRDAKPSFALRGDSFTAGGQVLRVLSGYRGARGAGR